MDRTCDCGCHKHADSGAAGHHHHEHHHAPHSHEHCHEHLHAHEHCGCAEVSHCCDHHCCCDGGTGGGGTGDGGTGDGDNTGGGVPGRPGHPTGTDDGTLDQNNPELTPGDLDNPNPPGVWHGPRKKLFLPFLYIRTNPGDTGTRPTVDHFWESTDIFVLAGVEPRNAPDKPELKNLGDTAFANRPNTLYAHVWNFGHAQAPEVLVEFYWCNPSLGIGPSSAHLIGQTFTSLGARDSGHAHRVVKCPVSWVSTIVNGGHECLVVRIWDMCSDPLGLPPWDASINRHVAQRNIHVVKTATVMKFAAGAAGVLPRVARGLESPLLLNVGPLFGMPAQVTVERVVPSNMPWLQLRSGRGKFPNAAAPTGTAILSPPNTIGGGMIAGPGATAHTVTGEDQQVGFTTTDAHPAPGSAHVYRIAARQGGQLVGGYTVVLAG